MQATQSGESFGLSGYGTLGLVHSDASQPWNFRRDLTQPTVDAKGVHAQADSRLGLQGQWRPHPQWEFTAQAVLRRRGSGSSASEGIEWGFTSYRPLPDLAIRLGRTSPDLFLLADHRNVGFAYPWVRPSVEFYGWMPLYALDGIDVAQSWHDEDGAWRIKLYSGRSRMTLAATAGYPDMRLHGHLSGLTLSREASRWTVKLSVAYGRLGISGAPILDGLRAGLGQAEGLPEPSVAQEAERLQRLASFHDFSVRYASIGVEWQPAARWMLRGELARVGGGLAANTGWYGYAGAGYRIANVTVFGIVARARPSSRAEPPTQWTSSLTPLIGADAAAAFDRVGSGAAQAHNLTRRDQRTLSLGLRWDIAPRLCVKLQWDRVRIAPNGSALWGDSTELPARATVVSTALDFLF